jgi:heptosyltransferase-3
MDHPCRPCGIDGCGGGKISECLTTLPVERVYAALTELIDATDASSGAALPV